MDPRTTITGNAGGDAVFRVTPNGTQIAEFGLAHTRRILKDGLWQDGDTTWACDGHVEGRIALADIIALQPDGRFTLQGRHADMVNLAGKRTSLAYLNHQLRSLDGVQDAAFFLPEEAGWITGANLSANGGQYMGW